MGWLSRNKKLSSGDAQIDVPAPGATQVGATAVGATDVVGSDPGPTAASAGVVDPTEGGALPDMGRFGPKVAITRLEVAPPELEWQLPFNGELYKLLPGPDRPDYSVMVLERPLHFYPGESFDLGRLEADQKIEDRRGRPMVRVHALLLCARFVGQQLHPGMIDLPVNLAYVIDNSLARDEKVDFAKIEYAAVGFVSEGHREAAPAEPPPSSDPGQEGDSVDTTDEVAGEPGTADAVGAPGAEGHGIEPGELAEDGPPPMIVMNQVTQEAARTLRDGIAEQRGHDVENITATLTLDEQHRVTGLSGNADGQPPVPTPDTFERLNGVLSALNVLPANHAVKGLTLRVEGNAVTTDVDYRH